jgi:LysM repeat protein
MTSIRKVTIFLSILSILVVGMGFTVSQAQAAACTQYHTVAPGEYLVKIAKSYGVDWRTIASINNIKPPWTIYPGQVLCISQSGTTPPPQPPPPGYSGFPTFSISSVVVDTTVTVQTYNLPPNDNFDVTMGPMGTKGVGGIKVATVNSGTGGAKQYTFNIPAGMKGAYQIAVRMQSPTSGFFAYNWFYNNTAGTGGQPPSPVPPPGYVGFPTFSILSVVRDTSVTVQSYNLPPNDSFIVTMGPMGTKGIGGIQVATVNSGTGGSKQFTFNIPAGLKGSYQISIRMQSPSSGFFAYNWFYNNTAVDP